MSRMMHAMDDPITSLPTAFPVDGGDEEQVLFLLEYAALAPSGHNTQPWRFRINGACFDLLADRSRALPVVDPDDRELTISCGACIEFFQIAARFFGKDCEVIYPLNDEEPALLARVKLKDGDMATKMDIALFDAISRRMTTRSTFEMEPVPLPIILHAESLAERFGLSLYAFETQDDRTAIAALVAKGDEIQFSDPEFRQELSSWVHSKRLGHKDGMSGEAFGMPDILSPLGRLVIRTFDIGDGVAAADEKKIMSGSPLLAILGSADDDIKNWLNTGRALASVLLYLTSEGLTASYLNQPIEVVSLRGELKAAARLTSLPQILLRVGKSTAPLTPSARRKATDLLVKS